MENLITISIVIVFVAAILAGAPLFAVIGGGTVLLFGLVAGESIAVPVMEMCRLANAPGFIAIPLFIFAGYLFAESRSADRLIRFSEALTGWIPGGLAIVTVAACTVFTAITGASGITILACGGLLLPALVNNRYSEGFSLGLITASGSSGVLFVPSLPILIYGMVAGVDITELFIAGILPGILIVCLLAGFGVACGIGRQVPTTPFSLARLGAALWEIKWIAPLPFVVIGGIYTGIITVGEAASVTAVYALVTECLIYREISAKKLVTVAIDSMVMVGAILIVLAVALGLTNFLVDVQVPQRLVAVVSAHVSSKILFLLLLNIFLLIVGCLMDIFSAIVIVVPLVAPVAATFDIDPVHLAIIFLANLEIGYLTPPVGINLFISSLRFDIPIVRLYRMVIPFLALLVAALLLISYFPALSLWLVELSGKRVPVLQF
ncbi:TRAP transporter large permease [Desulfosudis oleivorans]|uniref:TRAP dicarboxylate transporter, DctM subunit n=1 Tax=Desulfosudis oleivorans (strain DSM 6200 / JCM 39069 / Hxd3) TaxID=96561 RepID=A9A039_DESOH|nr:TRAP transporter large permease subunit [Desulfosudis oleivorans]ABW68958.1 TRAP dicarboxylate transporter, DctM subunit [Desulfosudis oleivorans Hxd3]